MFADYRRSLKFPDAEEFLDILLYRPAAYLFVRVVRKTPVTPNQITLASLCAGLIAAYNLSLGVPAAFIGAAVWYAAANVLDCADGQLARLNGNGTPLGRIIDGLADYLSSIAIFLGIGFGYAHGRPGSWLLVVAAGVSSALHAAVFDHRQSEFIALMRNEPDARANEAGRFRNEIAALQAGGGSRARILILRVYLGYLGLQAAGAPARPALPQRSTATAGRKTLIRLYSFLGPTTNRTLLILCALCNALPVYLWSVIVPLNVWLIILLVFRERILGKEPLSPVPAEELR